MRLVAEVKTHSPYGFESPYSWDHLFEIANRIGDIISIHAEEPWHGSLDLVRKAKTLTTKPILAKGIFATDHQVEAAVEAGASWVLVVNRIPKVYSEKCLIEPDSIAELQKLPPGTMAVWNSRNLDNGGIKPDDFSIARQEYLGWLCQASNIQHLKDINPLADAVLIGTHLPDIDQGIQQIGGRAMLESYLKLI